LRRDRARRALLALLLILAGCGARLREVRDLEHAHIESIDVGDELLTGDRAVAWLRARR
jgi:hypothetical protein